MKKTVEEKIFNIFALVVTTLFAFLCLVPILITISGSFTSEEAIYQGLTLWPKEFSTSAYKSILKNPMELLNAYKTTIIIVVFGVALSLLMTSMSAYVMYRKDFKYRNIFSFFFFFTTLFSGGLVPYYILICALNLRNTYTVQIISGLFSVTNMIIMRTYFTSNIPQSIVESAKVDGARDVRIFFSIILPVAGPILATVGLLTALGYWNSWQPSMLFIDNPKMYSLQYFLQKLFKDATLNDLLMQAGQEVEMLPKEGYKLAMSVCTMGPVILFYPFVQKYFVSGVTLGAVKG